MKRSVKWYIGTLVYAIQARATMWLRRARRRAAWVGNNALDRLGAFLVDGPKRLKAIECIGAHTGEWFERLLTALHVPFGV